MISHNATISSSMPDNGRPCDNATTITIRNDVFGKSYQIISPFSREELLPGLLGAFAHRGLVRTSSDPGEMEWRDDDPLSRNPYGTCVHCVTNDLGAVQEIIVHHYPNGNLEAAKAAMRADLKECKRKEGKASGG